MDRLQPNPDTPGQDLDGTQRSREIREMISSLSTMEDREKKVALLTKIAEMLPKGPGIEISEDIDRGGRFIVSNELHSYLTFPTLAEKVSPGWGISVGFDRGFDTLANVPQLEGLFVIDFDKTTSLASTAVLEIGRRHQEVYGEFQDVEDFLNYFKAENADTTMALLSGQFSKEEEEIIRQKVLNNRWDKNYEQPPSGDLIFYTYLYFKYSQNKYPSWVSNVSQLNKTIHSYTNNKLRIVNADLAGTNGMSQVQSQLQMTNGKLTYADFSNLDKYLNAQTRNTFRTTFGLSKDSSRALPIGDNILFLITLNTVPGLIVDDEVRKIPYIGQHFQEDSWNYVIRSLKDWEKQVQEDPEVGDERFLTMRLADYLYRSERSDDFTRLPNGVYTAGL